MLTLPHQPIKALMHIIDLHTISSRYTKDLTTHSVGGHSQIYSVFFCLKMYSIISQFMKESRLFQTASVAFLSLFWWCAQISFFSEGQQRIEKVKHVCRSVAMCTTVHPCMVWLCVFALVSMALLLTSDGGTPSDKSR